MAHRGATGEAAGAHAGRKSTARVPRIINPQLLTDGLIVAMNRDLTTERNGVSAGDQAPCVNW